MTHTIHISDIALFCTSWSLASHGLSTSHVAATSQQPSSLLCALVGSLWRARAGWHVCGSHTTHACELRRGVAPAVVLLLLPLVGQEDHPLFPCLLVKLRIGIPLPQHRTGGQHLLRKLAAFIAESICDTSDAPARPDEVRLLGVLIKVLPQNLNLLADEIVVEGRRFGRVERFHLPRLGLGIRIGAGALVLRSKCLSNFSMICWKLRLDPGSCALGRGLATASTCGWSSSSSSSNAAPWSPLQARRHRRPRNRMISWSSIGRFSSLYHGSRCARERSENCWNSISFRIVGRATSVCLIVRPRSVDRAISFRISALATSVCLIVRPRSVDRAISFRISALATSVCLIVRPCIVDRATSVCLILRPRSVDRAISFRIRATSVCLIVRPCIVDRATSVYLIVRPALYLRSDLTINKVFIVRRGFALLIVRPVFA